MIILGENCAHLDRFGDDADSDMDDASYCQLSGICGDQAGVDIAHCCAIFLGNLGIEMMNDMDIQISISERSSGWAINYT